MTHGDGETGPATHPFLARLDAGDKSAAAGFWQIVPVSLRKLGAEPHLPGPGSLGFAALRRRHRGRFQFGLLGESSSFLGMVGSGAVSIGASQTAIISVGQQFDLFANMTLATDAHVILSHLHGRHDSLVKGIDGAIASAFDARVNVGAFEARFSQPIYFEAGSLQLSLPHRRLQTGEVAFRNAQLSLGDGTRPLAMSVSYGGRLGRLGLRLDKRATEEKLSLAWRFKF